MTTKGHLTQIPESPEHGFPLFRTSPQLKPLEQKRNGQKEIPPAQVAEGAYSSQRTLWILLGGADGF